MSEESDRHWDRVEDFSSLSGYNQRASTLRPRSRRLLASVSTYHVCRDIGGTGFEVCVLACDLREDLARGVCKVERCRSTDPDYDGRRPICIAVRVSIVDSVDA